MPGQIFEDAAVNVEILAPRPGQAAYNVRVTRK